MRNNMEGKTLKIIFTGGGSGGHVFPIIAIVREIKKLLPEKTKLIYVGPKDEWVKLYLSQEQIEIKPILTAKIRRYFTLGSFFSNIIDFLKFPIGCIQAFFIVFFENPDLIFSKGGFGSVPTVIAGKILRIPIFLHESDISPGLANRIIADSTTEIFVSFEKTEYFDPKKMILVGNPIRREIFSGSAEGAKNLFKLTGEKPVLFFFEGSQGAQKINDLLLLVLPELLKDFEVIQQCGRKNFKQVKQESELIIPKELKKYYHLLPFLGEQKLKEAYFAADIIISRAGASNIFEAIALNKPLVLIPLSISAQNHQLKNAYYMAEKGAAIVIEESNLTPQFFLEKLRLLISNSEELEKMKKATESLAKPKAAKVIAHYLLEYLLI